MATTANVVINDGTANQTFAPVKRDGGRLSFLNKVGSVAAAFKSVVLGYDLHSARRKTDKVTLDLDFPLERTENGVVTASNVARGRVSLVLPDVMTDAERTAFYNLLKNGVAHAAFLGYVNGDPML